MRDRHLTDAVGDHPKLVDLASTPRERAQLTAFAQDLAAWLHGTPAEQVGFLTRVVTRIAQRELRGTRSIARDRPALAVEAAAEATTLLWPFLRERADRPPPEPEPEPEPEPPEIQDVVEGEDESAEGDGDGEGAPGRGESPDGDGEGDDPDEDGDGNDEGEDDDDGDGNDEGEGEDEDGDGNSDDDAEGDGEDDAEGDGEGGGDEDADADLSLDLTKDEDEDEDEDGETADAIREPPEDAAEDDLELPSLGASVDQAALDADRALSHLDRFFPGSGWSLAPGAVQALSMSRLPAFVQLIERLPELDRIADALGRLEQAERDGGADAGGSEEVTGVHFGGEVAHALPSELGLLADPDTEDLFYSRWAERRLVSLELSGAGLDGSGHGDRRGPIIACLDASASMDGPPELACKALILALCKRVVPAGRAVHVLMFGGRGQRLEIRLDRRPSALGDLLELLTRSFDGGTDFDGPLLRALDLLQDQALERADILVLTDGKAIADSSVVLRVEKAREALGVRVTSVVIGQGWIDGIRSFSDHVWHLKDARVDGAVGLVQQLAGR